MIGIEKVAALPFYTEGPAMDSAGNIYCSTLSGGSILKIDAEDRITEWAFSNCPNGQVILPGGDHLICDVELAAVRRFDPNGRFVKNEVEKRCAGMDVGSPNDLVTDRDGNIYFTDSTRNDGKVFFVGVNGRQSVLAQQLDYPNGLVLSRSQDILYVAESYKNRILKIYLKAPGKAMAKCTVFADLPVHAVDKAENNLPDGLTLDEAGNVWVAHYGMQCIHKLSPQGKLLESINTSMPLTSNLFFSNPETIIVTGGYGEPGPGALFRIYL